MAYNKRNERGQEHGLVVLDTQFKQRAFDGKWERIIKTMDNDNKYSYTTESGSRVTLIPTKWVTVGVYDYMLEFQD
jgi:hypothetical protein